MPRAFIAIRVPCTPALEAALRSLRRIDGAVKPVYGDALHLTLRFLGLVDDELMPQMLTAIHTAVQGISPFDFSVKCIGAFPTQRRPAVIWAATRWNDGVHRIVEALTSALDAIGFPSDGRPFHAHVTLARVKAKPPPGLPTFFEEYAMTDFGAVHVDRLELITSELRTDRAVHTVYETVVLKD